MTGLKLRRRRRRRRRRRGRRRGRMMRRDFHHRQKIEGGKSELLLLGVYFPAHSLVRRA